MNEDRLSEKPMLCSVDMTLKKKITKNAMLGVTKVTMMHCFFCYLPAKPVLTLHTM